ncbi:MAG TPA: Sec-independent protein translocase subunit TatA [Streptosporangiaceae bacterium]|nr:Sec-independent protein translocase subunit TatA [Streptosporangiaceae bacterium]
MLGDLFDSPWKILIIAVLLIVMFGAKKMPDAARSLGRSMRILKAEVQDLHGDHDAEDQAPPAPAPALSAPQLQQQQIDALQEQIRGLQQQQARDGAATVNGAAAPEQPRTQQPG